MTYIKNTENELDNPDYRESLILEEIGKQPRIHHNALKKIIVEDGQVMATKTFDKTVHHLIKEQRIIVEEDGNKKRYFLPNSTIAMEEFDKEIKNLFDATKTFVKDLCREYGNMTVFYKGLNSAFAIDSCSDTLKMISFYSAFLRESETFVEIEEKAKQCIIDIVVLAAKDKDKDILVPALRAHMLRRDIKDILKMS